jgi:hypothetical protein
VYQIVRSRSSTPSALPSAALPPAGPVWLIAPPPAPRRGPGTGGPSRGRSYTPPPPAPPPGGPRTPAGHRATGLGHIQPPGQRERRQQRMAHPGPGTPQPGHEDLPVPARRPDITPVPRPGHQRPGPRRAVRAGEPQITAGRRVRIDRKRARPYDGHGRHRPGSLLAAGATRAFPTPGMCRQRVRRRAPRRPAAPGPAARCVRRRAATEAPFRNNRRSADAGDAEGDA